MQPPSPLRGAIVAMTAGRVIGIDGGLPWHYSEDLKRFKQRTLEQTVIMGRLTWESIGCRPLPRRRNIVISRSTVDGVEFYHGLTEAIDACGNSDLWVIGGAQIYSLAMDHLNLLDITLVPDEIDDPAAVRFPEIDPRQWQQVQQASLPGDAGLVNRIYHRVRDEHQAGRSGLPG